MAEWMSAPGLEGVAVIIEGSLEENRGSTVCSGAASEPQTRPQADAQYSQSV